MGRLVSRHKAVVPEETERGLVLQDEISDMPAEPGMGKLAFPDNHHGSLAHLNHLRKA